MTPRIVGEIWERNKAETEEALRAIRAIDSYNEYCTDLDNLIEIPWDQKVTHLTVKFLDAISAGIKKRQAYKTRWQKIKEWALPLLKVLPYVLAWGIKRKIK